MKRLFPRALLPAAAACALMLGVVGSTAGPTFAGGAAYTFSIYLRSTCLYGTGPASTAFQIQLKDRDGKSVETKNSNTSGTGSLNVCFGRALDSGDKLTVNDGLNHRTFGIPFLTFSANRVSNVVSGKAPAGSSIRVTGTHNVSLGSGGPIPQVNATAGTNGQYSADLTAVVDLIGADYLVVGFTTGAGDNVSRTGYVPYFVATRDSSNIYGTMNRGQLATFTERNGSAAIKGTARVVGQISTGYYSTDLADKNGATIWTRTGDTLSASFASDAKLKVPAMSLAANASTDHVNGKCQPNAPFMAYGYNVSGSAYAYQSGTTSATGNVSVDMSSGPYASFDLKSGDLIQLQCRTAAGDRITIKRNVP